MCVCVFVFEPFLIFLSSDKQSLVFSLHFLVWIDNWTLNLNLNIHFFSYVCGVTRLQIAYGHFMFINQAIVSHSAILKTCTFSCVCVWESNENSNLLFRSFQSHNYKCQIHGPPHINFDLGTHSVSHLIKLSLNDCA